MFEAVDKRFGPLDALVNNAGVVDLKARARRDERRTARADDAHQRHRLDALRPRGGEAHVDKARRQGRRNRQRQLGRASIRGAAGEYVDYAASKGAIDTFTIGLAREVADEGVRVNAVRPGIIDTEIHASGGQPGRPAAMRQLIPMQREGQADEVAHAILWLLSDEASYTTGALLDVSGGR